MNRKPIIGINADYRQSKIDSPELVWLNAGYFDGVTKSGGVPMIIPPLASDDDLRSVLHQVDGLVLTGCKLDLDPVRMGLEKHPGARPMPLRREDFDRRLARLAYDMKIPTLAIGAGMQVLNVICGGTLLQHLPEDVLKSLCHRDPVEKCLRHVIEIVPGTRMDAIYGPGEIRVNSDHHMGIDNLANVFRVSATSMDGVVEAYESIEENWWCVGVQFHPENDSASALDMQVFESLVEGCQTQAEPEIISLTRRRAA